MLLKIHIILYFYFAFTFTICISSSSKYSQEEIDSAWRKMIKREKFYRTFENQLGCWPQNVIPFAIRYGFTQDQEQHILRHIYQIQNKTCLRWVLKNQLEGVKKFIEFVHVDEDDSCHMNESLDGKGGIATRLVLGDDCFPEESVIHEMMHALGFLHEHQRLDRDCYVDVNPTTAEEDTDFKIIYDDTTYEKWPYDKRSITHYTRIFNTIKDIEEPIFSLGLWYHTIGDKYGLSVWFDRTGSLTCLDTMKILHRYCGAPSFCDIDPLLCDRIKREEEDKGCKQIYLDIISGRAIPSQLLKNSA